MKHLILLLLSFNAYALEWQAPTEREDGTKLSQSEISHYVIYIHRDDTLVRDVISLETTYTLSPLPPGTYTINITTVDKDVRESVYSEPREYIVETAKPNPPIWID